METYQFTIVLADQRVFDGDALLDFADRLFPEFGGDIVPAVSCGTAVVMCTLESASLENAIRSVIEALAREGLSAKRVEVEAENLPAA